MDCKVDSFFTQKGVLGASFIAHNAPEVPIFIAFGDHVRVWLSSDEALKLKTDLEEALEAFNSTQLKQETTNPKPERT